jgi:hypothetical protein
VNHHRLGKFDSIRHPKNLYHTNRKYKYGLDLNARHSPVPVLVLLLILPVVCLGNSSDSDVHDVVVTSVTAWPNLTLPSYVSVNVTVENEGTVPETFNVTVHADSLTVTSATVIDLTPASNSTLKLRCDLFPLRSMIFPPLPWKDRQEPMIVNVSIRAEASEVAGETNTTNNVHVGGTISLIWWFIDVNGDGRINIIDLAIMAKFFGYQPVVILLDFDGDGKLDILDIAYIAKYFRTVYFEPSNPDDP